MISAEQLALIAGAALSLFFSYFPGANVKFAALDSVHKRLVMLLLIVVSAAGVFGLSCASLVISVTCDQAGGWGLLELVILAAIANQSAFQLSPESAAVKDIKFEQAMYIAPHGQG